MDGWTKVGQVGVDAGILYLGDPCYVLHQEEPPPEIGKNWADFCDKLSDDCYTSTQIGKCTGVVVSTGVGDGLYSVYVKYSDLGSWGKRVKEVKVVFLDDSDDEEES